MKKTSVQLLTILLLTFATACSSTSSSEISPVSGDEATTTTLAGPYRCTEMNESCGYGWDSSLGKYVDIWELTDDGTTWTIKREYYVEGQVRCEGLVEGCGYRWDEATGKHYDFWVWDYGTNQYVDKEMISIP
tara:strand:- start:154 stop:552 length:399 start_codon:yes stop_codon:yes gene_type:complete